MNLLQKIKYLKEIQNKEELNGLTAKLPENEEVCKEILKMLDNTSVAVEKNQVEDSTTSLYLVLNNKILIGNMKQSFVRIQTIAHECIHSIQNRKTLLFHFFLANAVQFYFIFQGCIRRYLFTDTRHQQILPVAVRLLADQHPNLQLFPSTFVIIFFIPLS